MRWPRTSWRSSLRRSRETASSRPRHGGVREEQLIAVDLVVGDRLLAFRRDQPVDKLLAEILLHVRVLARVHQHDAVLIEQPSVAFDYDIELAAETDRAALDPFRRYKTADFRRISDPDKPLSSFFGFQSSRKSFFTNMLVLAIGFSLSYWNLPRWGIFRAIYDNTALTTASLVLGFLMADVVGPWVLVRAICGLSRLRPKTIFQARKVWGLKKRRRS